jgi:hypothetical protein
MLFSFTAVVSLRHTAIAYFIFEVFAIIEIPKACHGRSGDILERLPGKESLVGGYDHIGKGQQAREDIIADDFV